MNKYSFAKRLKRLLDTECEIAKMETDIARKSAKYYKSMTELKTTLTKQNQYIEIYRLHIDRIRHRNEKLEKFTQEQEEILAATKKNVQDLQREYEEARRRQIDQRMASLIQMDLIHKIKQTTQTYFNMDALPDKFQGVKLCQNDISTEWKPFVNDAKQWIGFIEEQLELIKQKESSTIDKNKTITLS